MTDINITATTPPVITATLTTPDTITLSVSSPSTVTVAASVGNVGDMTKAVYDTDNDGVVDNSESLGGVAASGYVQAASVNYVDLTDGGATTLHTHSSYYTLQWGTASAWSPADSTTYYYGGGMLNFAIAARQALYIPVAGTIIAADFCSFVGTTLATAETSSAWIRLNNTTDTLISDAIQLDANFERFANTSLAISVNAGDTVEIKWTTPAWVTNATNSRQYGIITVRV